MDISPTCEFNSVNKSIFNIRTFNTLQKGEIIDSRSNYIKVIQKSYTSSIKRSMNGDSRDQVIERLTNEYINCRETAKLILESKYLTIYDESMLNSVRNNGIKNITANQFCNFDIRVKKVQEIIDTISETTGFEHIAATYEDDEATVGAIERLRDNVNSTKLILQSHLNNIIKQKEEFELFH